MCYSKFYPCYTCYTLQAWTRKFGACDSWPIFVNQKKYGNLCPRFVALILPLRDTMWTFLTGIHTPSVIIRMVNHKNIVPLITDVIYAWGEAGVGKHAYKNENGEGERT